MTTKSFRLALAFTIPLLCVSYGTPAFADVTHDYELNGSYSDANGGPPATPNGGNLTDNFGFYTFTANQGLVLDRSVILGGTYDIQVRVGFTATGANGWTKIADFTGLVPDIGWYINPSHQVCFFYLGGCAGGSGGTVSFDANATQNIFELTRDAGTSVMTGFFDGTQVFSFTDSSNVFVLGTQDIVFFQDDTSSGMQEGGSGLADYIKTSFPTGQTPEPSSLLLLGTSLSALGAARRKWLR
jgi:hypothetical protein